MASISTPTVYKFGTSGYRHDQDDHFNEAVIRQITQAISDYLITQIEAQGKLLPVLIGGDTREKSRRFIPFIADLLKENGLEVFQSEFDLPSPVLAFAAKEFKSLGTIAAGFDETIGAILMTASHNPWPYGGYNFLTPDGAVMPTPVSKQFEKYQAQPLNKKLDRSALGISDPAAIHLFNPYEAYKKHLKEEMGINYAAIKASGVKIFYDPLYATGRRYLPQLLKDEGISDVTVIHNSDVLPENYTGMPEPTGDNLPELKALLEADTHPLKVGLANDGDSDRFGVFDEKGRFLNANEVLALILHLLLKHRHQSGVIVRSQATTHLLDALAKEANLTVIQTPVGYKYIAEEFIEHNERSGPKVLLGGESSGGVSVIGHLPEKDGILANLLIAELIGLEKRPLSEILEQIRASVPQRYAFRELGVHTERKDEVLARFRALQLNGGSLGEAKANIQIDGPRSSTVSDTLEKGYGTRDGVKLLLKNGDESWLLIRTSGTEPLARVYVEGVAATAEAAQERSQVILDTVMKILTDEFEIPSTQIKERK
jgi:phosphomannomutase